MSVSTNQSTYHGDEALAEKTGLSGSGAVFIIFLPEEPRGFGLAR